MAAERTVDGYVAALPDGQREIADAVRRLVRSAAPEAREAFKWAKRQLGPEVVCVALPTRRESPVAGTPKCNQGLEGSGLIATKWQRGAQTM